LLRTAIRFDADFTLPEASGYRAGRGPSSAILAAAATISKKAAAGQIGLPETTWSFR
jgi:hypothetical protein